MKTAMTLSSIRDTAQIIRTVRNANTFRIFVRSICDWAKRRYLYSNRIGFFGGFGWTILCVKIIEQSRADASPEELLRNFFALYSEFDWNRAIVRLECNSNANYRRDDHSDKIVILTLNPPFKNSARNCSESSREILRNEFKRARDLLVESKFDELFEERPLLSEFKVYLELRVNAANSADFAAWSGWIESRLVILSIKLERIGIFAHPSPYRYKTPGESPWPFSCCYIVALRKNASGGSKETDQRKFAEAILEFQRAIDDWNGRNQNMEFHVTQKRAEKMNVYERLGELELDVNTDDLIEADPFPEAIAEQEEVQEKPEEPEAEDSRSSAKPKKPKKGQKKQQEEEEEGQKRRNRTSEEVYNRIKWDPEIDSATCFIGYEDRFLGVKEYVFDNWRKNEDEWIPWHRVLYFRVGDEIVWDRRTRFDKLFK